MTKKHFIALAAYMRNTRKSLARNVYIVLCHDMAELCANYNPDFNRDKFLEACGLYLGDE